MHCRRKKSNGRKKKNTEKKLIIYTNISIELIRLRLSEWCWLIWHMWMNFCSWFVHFSKGFQWFRILMVWFSLVFGVFFLQNRFRQSVSLALRFSHSQTQPNGLSINCTQCGSCSVISIIFIYSIEPQQQ